MAKKAGKKTAPKQKKKQEKNVNNSEIYTVAGGIITVFTAIFVYVNLSGEGILSGAICDWLMGVFGITAYCLPILFGGVTVYNAKYKNTKKFWEKLCEGLGLIASAGAILSIIYKVDLKNAYPAGIDHQGGGVIGTAISEFLINMVQTPATVLILLLLIILFVQLLINMPVYSYIYSGAIKLFYLVKEIIEEKIYDIKENRKEKETAKPQEKEKKKTLIFQKPEEKPLPQPRKAKEEITQAPVDNGIEAVFADIQEEIKLEEKPAVAEQQELEELHEENEETEEATSSRHVVKRVKDITDEEKEEYNEELDNAIMREEIEYIIPDIELLNQPAAAKGDRREELRKTAEKLITVLANFGVKAKLLHVTQGPTVTRFEIQPDTGIKLSKIIGLADDIALNLAVQTVLVAPVPGKVAVGVEIPNTSVSTVSIREIIDSPEFKNAKSKLAVALGKDIGGNVIIGDIAKMPHVLIAGATGSGKSVCINSIVMSILYKAKPEEVKLIMVDPKVVELGVYNGIPHLLIPVVTDPKKAAGALNWAVSEMMRRYKAFEETGVRKIDGYNQLMETTGGDKMPNIVIIIDELADLMMVASKEVEDYICRLAQLARAAGIHLIIATQRPSVDVITGLIKANVPSRIAFAVSSQVDSRTILDRAGADKLLGMGDMLYSPSGSRNPTRVQGAFVSDKEIENVLEFIKETTGETHYSQDLADQIERCTIGENGVTPDTEEEGDPLLSEAITLAIEMGKISTSMIQRKLGVGYARAGRIVDQMEARGIVSAANGSKPRDVLVSHADMVAVKEDNYDE